MDLTLTLAVIALISLVLNIRHWLGRGGGRIRIPGGWVNLTRHQLWLIFNREMTDAESSAFHAALQRGDKDTAETILADVTVRYLQRQ